MRKKYLTLDDSQYAYVTSHRSDRNDPFLKAIREETAALGDDARMQISQEQGAFLSLLTASLSVRSAIEIGTFTGYSSICIARSLAAGGKLLCLDASEEWTGIARRYWIESGVEARIDLRIGPAIDTLKRLDHALSFDLAFIDADKTEYDAYFELLLPHMRAGGVLVFDNMLWGGRLASGETLDASGRAIDALNRKLAGDPRVECVLLPVADGIQLCRKR